MASKLAHHLISPPNAIKRAENGHHKCPYTENGNGCWAKSLQIYLSNTYIWGALPDGVSAAGGHGGNVVGEAGILDASVVLSYGGSTCVFLNWTQHMLMLNEFFLFPGNTYMSSKPRRMRRRYHLQCPPWRYTQRGWSRCPPHPSRLYRIARSETWPAGRCWKKLQQDTLFVTMARRRLDLSQARYSHLPILSFLETPLLSFVSISLVSSCAIENGRINRTTILKYIWKIFLT